MVDRRKPSQRRPAGRPPTRRRVAAPRADKQKQQMLIIGGAVGGLILLIIIIAVASSGGGEPRNTTQDTPYVPEPTTERKVDVSRYVSEGTDKCTRAADMASMLTGTLKNAAEDKKEGIREKFRAAFKLFDEGIEAFKQAATRSGDSYPTREYETARARMIHEYTAEIEAQGQAYCDEGFQLINSTDEMMTGGRSLSADEKSMLRDKLKKGIDLIAKGMNLFDASNQVSGHTFDTIKYGKARKAASMKLGELK